jgi:uncharacterized protein (DUF4213/DUF364 family)
MSLIEALLDSLDHTSEPVRTVCTGAFWTAVTTRHTGLAPPTGTWTHNTATSPVCERCGQSARKTAGDLAAYVRSSNTVAAAIGLATINSLLEVDETTCVERGAYELPRKRGRDGMWR